MVEKSYSTGEFAEKTGLHVQTVKRYCREGEINYKKTPGGHRRIPHSELEKFTITEENQKDQDKAITYTRVSSHSQQNDLKTQQEELENYAKENNLEITQTYSDIGSGLNENRRDLNKLLDNLEQTKAGKLLITYEDRLTRFGISYIERLLGEHNIELVTVNEEENKNCEEELVEDMISLVSSFSGRLYGMRSKKRKEITRKVKKVITND